MSVFYIHPDIAKARTLSTAFYTDPQYFELVIEKFFASSWQLIGDADQVAQPGDAYPTTLLPHLLEEPLLLTRDHDGTLHCLSNVCTHRGNLVIQTPCRVRHLQCRYHGRRFGLDGRVQYMPEFGEVENFPGKEDDLHELPLYRWGKWLFTSLAPREEAVTYLSEIRNRLAWLPLGDFHFRPGLSRDYEVQAHWALYVENYLEGFHIPFVHAGLNAVIDYGSYTTELFPFSNLQLGMARDGELAFELPASNPDFGKRVGGYYFWIFPNMMFNFYPWGLSLNIVKPVTPSKTIVSFLTYVWKENLLEKGAGSNLFQVEMEDEEVVEAVQKGIRSRYYTHGRYSATREQGIHHFHRLVAQMLG